MADPALCWGGGGGVTLSFAVVRYKFRGWPLVEPQVINVQKVVFVSCIKQICVIPSLIHLFISKRK